MTPLEITERDLREHWLRASALFREGLPDRLEKQRERVRESMPVLNAVIERNRGDHEAVPALLESDRELSPDDRQTLAQFLRGDFDPEIKEGRPKARETTAAAVAMRFYRQWKDLNKQRGDSDHGHAASMKDRAAKFVVTELFPRLALDVDKVRENMERALDRQN